MVHEVGIPFITQRIIEDRTGRSAFEVYERTAAELVAAYGDELESHDRPQLESLGIKNIDATLNRRQAEFLNALRSLSPVFRIMASALNEGLLQPGDAAPITVELPGETLTIRPYNPMNPVTKRFKKARDSRSLEEASPEVKGQLGADGFLYMRGGMNGTNRQRALNHEARGHVVSESSRREMPGVYAELLNRLNSLPPSARLDLMKRFYFARIAPFESQSALLPDASAREFAARINGSRAVMPDNPELWGSAVSLSAGTGEPVFNAYALDEMLAMFFERLEGTSDEYFDEIRRFRKPLTMDPSIARSDDDAVKLCALLSQYFIHEQESGRPVPQLERLGYFQPLEEILQRNVEGAAAINICASMRLADYLSAKSGTGGKNAGLLKKLFGVKKRSSSSDDEQKKKDIGELRFWMDKAIDELKEAMEGEGIEITDEHAITHAFEETWFEYMKNKGGPGGWNEQEFMETLIKNIVEESPDLAEGDLDDLLELLPKILEMTDEELRRFLEGNPEYEKYIKFIQHARKLYQSLKKTVEELDATGEGDWRKELEEMMEDDEDAEENEHEHQHQHGIPHQHPQKQGEEHQAPAKKQDGAAQQAGSLGQMLSDAMKSLPQISGLRPAGAASFVSAAAIAMEKRGRKPFSGTTPDQQGSRFVVNPIIASSLGVDNEKNLPPEMKPLWDEMKKRLRKRRDELGRRFRADPDNVLSALFGAWMGAATIRQDEDLEVYREALPVLEAANGRSGTPVFYLGEPMEREEVVTVLRLLEFLNPDAENFPEALGRDETDDSPIRTLRRFSGQTEKRLFALFGKAGVGKSHLFKAYVRHVLEQPSAKETDWLFFSLSTNDFMAKASQFAVENNMSMDQAVDFLLELVGRFLDRPNVMLFIDEGHQMAQLPSRTSTKPINFYEQLKKQLANRYSYVRVVYATTEEEYNMYMRRDQGEALQSRTESYNLSQLSRSHVESIMEASVGELEGNEEVKNILRSEIREMRSELGGVEKRLAELNRQMRKAKKGPERESLAAEFKTLSRRRQQLEDMLRDMEEELESENWNVAELQREMTRCGLKFERDIAGRLMVIDRLISLKDRFAPQWASPAREKAWLEAIAARVVSMIQSLEKRSVSDAQDIVTRVNHLLYEQRLISNPDTPDLVRNMARTAETKRSIASHALGYFRYLREMDEIARTRTIRQKQVDESISDATGIPYETLIFEPGRSREEIRKKINSMLIGQEQAVDMIVDIIVEYFKKKEDDRAGDRFAEPLKLMVVGPSRVGKSYLATVLAVTLLGNKAAVETIPMAEYTSPHQVARLSGAPPGYIGYGNPGLITRIFEKHNYSLVVLVDEIEKGHPRIMDYLYPLWRPGVGKDMMGNEVYAKNSVFVVSSNLGLSDPVNLDDRVSQMHVKRIYQLLRQGDQDQLDYEVNHFLADITRRAVEGFLRPDTITRLTRPEAIFFKWLHPDDAHRLIDELWLPRLIEEMKKRGVVIHLDESAMRTVAKTKTRQFEHFSFAKEVPSMTDGIRSSSGDYFFLDAEHKRLVMKLEGEEILMEETVQETVALEVPLEVENARNLLVRETAQGPEALILHDGGIVAVDRQGDVRVVYEGTGIQKMAVDGDNILFVRDGKTWLGKLDRMDEARPVELPEGFECKEIALGAGFYYVSDGFNVFQGKLDATDEAPARFGKKQKTEIYDLQVLEDGSLAYLQKHTVTHQKIKIPEQAAAARQKELERIRGSLLIGDGQYISREVESKEGKKERRVYRKVLKYNEKGERTPEYRQYMEQQEKLEGLKKELSDMLEKSPAERDRQRLDELDEQIRRLMEEMAERFWIQRRPGFVQQGAENFEVYVRLPEQEEQNYIQFEKQSEKIEEEMIKQIETEKVKEEAVFLIVRDTSGKVVGRRKDLSFRGGALYEGSRKEELRRQVLEQFGDAESRIHLRKDENGRLQVMDFGKRNASEVYLFRHSELAAELVRDAYTDVLQGISNLEREFQNRVRAGIETNPRLRFGTEVTLKLGEKDENGKRSIVLDGIQPTTEVAALDVSPEAVAMVRDDSEKEFMRRIDEWISKAEAEGREVRPEELMRIAEEVSGVDVEKLIREFSQDRESDNAAELARQSAPIEAPEGKERNVIDQKRRLHAALSAIGEESDGFRVDEGTHAALEAGMAGLYNLAQETVRGLLTQAGEDAKDIDRKLSQKGSAKLSPDDPAYIGRQTGFVNRDGTLGLAGEISFQGYLAPNERLKIHELLNLQVLTPEDWDRYHSDPDFQNKRLVDFLFYLRRLGGKGIRFITEKETDAEGRTVYRHRLRFEIPLGAEMDAGRLAQLMQAESVAARPEAPKYEEPEMPPIYTGEETREAKLPDEIRKKLDKLNEDKTKEDLEKWLGENKEAGFDPSNFVLIRAVLDDILKKNAASREGEKLLEGADAKRMWVKIFAFNGIRNPEPLIDKLSDMDLLGPVYESDDPEASRALPRKYYVGPVGQFLKGMAKYYVGTQTHPDTGEAWDEQYAYEYLREQFSIEAPEGTKGGMSADDFAVLSSVLDFMNPEAERYDAALNREREMSIMRDQLLKREERSLLLTGEAGTGKTYMVRSFVKREVETYRTRRLYFELDALRLRNAMRENNISAQQMFDILKRFANHAGVIIYIDEAHELTEFGRQGETIIDVALEEMADPDSHLRFILSTTDAEAQKQMAGPGWQAKRRRIRPLKLEPLSFVEVKIILRRYLARLKREWAIKHPDIALDIDDGLEVLVATFRERFFAGAPTPREEVQLVDALKSYLEAKYLETGNTVRRQPGKVAHAARLLLARNLSAKWMSAAAVESGGEVDEETREKALRELKKSNSEVKRELIRMMDHLLFNVMFARENYAEGSEGEIRAHLGAEELLEFLESEKGIPRQSLEMDIEKALQSLREDLKKEIIGQDDAIDTLVDYLKVHFTRKKDPEHKSPFFAIAAGLSTVGKTQTAIELTKALFGSEKFYALLRMSDFALEHNAARLIGAPAGYIGYGDMPELVKLYLDTGGMGVFNMDEAEKAFPTIFNHFLTAFGEGGTGETTDATGRFTIRWGGYLVYATSNLGVTGVSGDKETEANKYIIEKVSEMIREIAGGDQALEDILYFELNRVVMGMVRRALEVHFRPEFRNRQSIPADPGFLYFGWLHPDDARRVVDEKLFRNYSQLLAEGGVTLDLDQGEENWIHRLRFGRQDAGFAKTERIGEVTDVAYEPSGERIVLDAEKKMIHVFQGPNEISGEIDVPLENAKRLFVLPKDGSFQLLVVGTDGAALLDPQGNLIRHLPRGDLPGDVGPAAYSDGRLIFSAGAELFIVTPETLQVERRVPFPAEVLEASKQSPVKDLSFYQGNILITVNNSLYRVSLEHPETAVLLRHDDKGIENAQYDDQGRIVYLSKRDVQRVRFKSEKEIQKYIEQKRQEDLTVKYQDIVARQEEGKIEPSYWLPATKKEEEEYERLVAEAGADEEKLKVLRAKYWKKQAGIGFTAKTRLFRRLTEEEDEEYRRFQEAAIEEHLRLAGGKGAVDEAARLARNEEQLSGIMKDQMAKKTVADAPVLVFVNPDGQPFDASQEEPEYRDLFYRERPKVTTDEKVAEGRMSEWNGEGMEGRSFYLRRGADGRLLAVVPEAGEVSHLETVRFSKIADYIVRHGYKNPMRGITELQHLFRRTVVEAVQPNAQRYRTKITLSYGSEDEPILLSTETGRVVSPVDLVPMLRGTELSDEKRALFEKADVVFDSVINDESLAGLGPEEFLKRLKGDLEKALGIKDLGVDLSGEVREGRSLEMMTEKVLEAAFKRIVEQIFGLPAGGYDSLVPPLPEETPEDEPEDRELEEFPDIDWDEQNTSEDLFEYTLDDTIEDATFRDVNELMDEEIDEEPDEDVPAVPVGVMKKFMRDGVLAIRYGGGRLLEDGLSLDLEAERNETPNRYVDLPANLTPKQREQLDRQRRILRDQGKDPKSVLPPVTQGEVDRGIRRGNGTLRFGIVHDDEVGTRIVAELEFGVELGDDFEEIRQLLRSSLERLDEMEKEESAKKKPDEERLKLIQFLKYFRTQQAEDGALHHLADQMKIGLYRPKNEAGVESGTHAIRFEVPVPAKQGARLVAKHKARRAHRGFDQMTEREKERIAEDFLEQELRRIEEVKKHPKPPVARRTRPAPAPVAEPAEEPDTDRPEPESAAGREPGGTAVAEIPAAPKRGVPDTGEVPDVEEMVEAVTQVTEISDADLERLAGLEPLPDEMRDSEIQVLVREHLTGILGVRTEKTVRDYMSDRVRASRLSQREQRRREDARKEDALYKGELPRHYIYDYSMEQTSLKDTAGNVYMPDPVGHTFTRGAFGKNWMLTVNRYPEVMGDVGTQLRGIQVHEFTPDANDTYQPLFNISTPGIQEIIPNSVDILKDTEGEEIYLAVGGDKGFIIYKIPAKDVQEATSYEEIKKTSVAASDVRAADHAFFAAQPGSESITVYKPDGTSPHMLRDVGRVHRLCVTRDTKSKDPRSWIVYFSVEGQSTVRQVSYHEENGFDEKSVSDVVDVHYPVVGLDADSDGNLMIARGGEAPSLLVRWSHEGKAIPVKDTKAVSDDNPSLYLFDPAYLRIGPDGNLYVADQGRMQSYSDYSAGRRVISPIEGSKKLMVFRPATEAEYNESVERIGGGGAGGETGKTRYASQELVRMVNQVLTGQGASQLSPEALAGRSASMVGVMRETDAMKLADQEIARKKETLKKYMQWLERVFGTNFSKLRRQIAQLNAAYKDELAAIEALLKEKGEDKRFTREELAKIRKALAMIRKLKRDLEILARSLSHTVDKFQQDSAEGRSMRQAEADSLQKIVDANVTGFLQVLSSSPVGGGGNTDDWAEGLETILDKMVEAIANAEPEELEKVEPPAEEGGGDDGEGETTAEEKVKVQGVFVEGNESFSSIGEFYDFLNDRLNSVTPGQPVQTLDPIELPIPGEGANVTVIAGVGGTAEIEMWPVSGLCWRIIQVQDGILKLEFVDREDSTTGVAYSIASSLPEAEIRINYRGEKEADQEGVFKIDVIIRVTPEQLSEMRRVYDAITMTDKPPFEEWIKPFDSDAGHHVELVFEEAAGTETATPPGATQVSREVRTIKNIFMDLMGPFTEIQKPDENTRMLLLNSAEEGEPMIRRGSMASYSDSEADGESCIITITGEKDTTRKPTVGIFGSYYGVQAIRGAVRLILRQPGDSAADGSKALPTTYQISEGEIFDLRVRNEDGVLTYYFLVPDEIVAKIKDNGQEELLDFTLDPELTETPQRVVIVSEKEARDDLTRYSMFERFLAPPMDYSGLRVLIMDGGTDYRTALESLLKERGVGEVRTTRNPDEFFAELEARPGAFDLIILDPDPEEFPDVSLDDLLSSTRPRNPPAFVALASVLPRSNFPDADIDYFVDKLNASRDPYWDLLRFALARKMLTNAELY
ncbi:MAG TPA: AAA family ATPase, partial [Candidatus Omnitrophota bacterium]|nr:AAA family ATPase [Candidatus Omnitrophota bacterium]